MGIHPGMRHIFPSHPDSYVEKCDYCTRDASFWTAGAPYYSACTDHKWKLPNSAPVNEKPQDMIL